jgi:xanthine/CO dehydrogenase XdhC/CoxF family maturation factor
MSELRRIVQAVDAVPGTLCLATVVDVVGSAYRGPTARMLVLPDGRHIGTISGGCLERDLCNAAPELVRGGPRLISFDTRSDATSFNPRYNRGCSGIVYVLVERITRDDLCPARHLRRVLETDRPLVVATIYQSDGSLGPIGTRLFAPQLPSAIRGAFERVEGTGRPVCCEFAGGSQSTRLLIERIDPPKPLWVFGGGDDVCPLVAMAGELGWSVTVLDHRARNLARERFPKAGRLLLAQPAEAADLLVPGPRTAALLMTHSFPADAVLLPWLLESSAHFVGILGPKSRTGKLLRQLHAAGRMPSGDSLDRLRTPLGLDIGAASPAEIAVAILSEIIAAENLRGGGRLQARNGPIHEPIDREVISLRPSGAGRP